MKVGCTFLKGTLKIFVSEVQQEGSCYEQEIEYQHNGRTRKEVFVGRSREELSAAVAQRKSALEGQN